MMARALPIPNRANRMPGKRAVEIRFILVAALTLAVRGFAGESWEKQPEQWTPAEAYQVITDSLWTSAKSRMDVSWTVLRRRVDPLTNLPTDSPIEPPEGPLTSRVALGSKRPLPDVSVLWWSAKVVRLAQQRLRELRDPSSRPAPLVAAELSDFVLIVEGAEALRILRDAGEDLRERASSWNCQAGYRSTSSRFTSSKERRRGKTSSSFILRARSRGGRQSVPTRRKSCFTARRRQRARGPDARTNSLSVPSSNRARCASAASRICRLATPLR